MNFYHFTWIGISILTVLSLITNCSDAEGENQRINSEKESASILIFTKTEGYRHESISDGVKAIEEIASENKLTTSHTEEAAYFQADSLDNFDLIIFLNTTGDILNDNQQESFQQFIKSGGGFVGIHAATDTEYDWPWYGKMVGAYFNSHPEVQEATISVIDKEHPSTSFLPDEWVRTDEWYNFKDINPDINVLLNLEESSYEGGENGTDHPIAWYHEYDGGRIFYTGGGHTSESYTEPLFRRHLEDGSKYVLN